jgi:hypothetical protein
MSEAARPLGIADTWTESAVSALRKDHLRKRSGGCALASLGVSLGVDQAELSLDLEHTRVDLRWSTAVYFSAMHATKACKLQR